MRKMLIVSMLVATPLVAVGTAAQQPAPFARSVERIQRGPQVVSAKKQGTPAYAGDSPLGVEVEIVNDASAPLDTQLVVTRLLPTQTATPTEAGEVARVPVRAAPNGRVTVTYADAKGLIDGCGPSYHRLALGGGGPMFMRIMPTCSFGAMVRNPEAGLAPDRIASRHDNRVSYHSARLVNPTPACGGALVMEATLENQTTSSAPNAYVEVVAPNGERLTNVPLRHTLAPGASKQARQAGVRFVGQAGRWVLNVGADVDPSKLYQVGVAADVTRLCAVKTELTNIVPPLPMPPRSYRE